MTLLPLHRVPEVFNKFDAAPECDNETYPANCTIGNTIQHYVTAAKSQRH